jgi:hypothetical protein
MGGQGRRGWRAWWPLVLLLALGASRWLIAAQWPETESTVASEAAGCGLAALLIFGGSMFWRGSGGVTGSRWDTLRWAAAGALVLVGPLVGMVAGGEVGGTDLMVALALIPVVAAVATVASSGGSKDLAGRLWPGLAALAGLLLMVPQPSLSNARADLVLGLSAVLPGVGAAWMCRDGGGRAAARLVAGLSGAGLLLGLGMATQAGLRIGFSEWAALLDGLTAVLGLLALVQLGAMRWAAQFAVVPLAISLEGLVVLRPRLDWRVVAGVGLLLAASVYLLAPPAEDEGEVGSQLGLR